MSEPLHFRNRLAHNTVTSVAVNGWTIVLTIVTLGALLRGLGAEVFGVWVLVTTFSATNGWLSVVTTGLGVASTRRVAEAIESDEPGGLARAGGAALVGFALAGAAAALLMATFGALVIDTVFDVDAISRSTLQIVTILVGIQILAEHLFVAATAVLEGLQSVAMARSLDAARRTLSSIAMVAAVALGGGITAVAATSLMGSASLAVVALSVVHFRRLRVVRPLRGEVAAVAGYARTVSAVTAAGVVHRTVDRIVAGIFVGPSAVSLVEIANQIQGGTTALLSASTYPILSSAPWLVARRDPDGLRQLVERGTRYSVSATIPLVVAAVFLAAPFVRTWVGDDYGEAIGLAQVAVLYVALAAPLQAGSNALQGMGRATDVLRASVLSVAVNVIASVILVESVGLVGVFLGTMIGTVMLLPILGRSISVQTGVHVRTLLASAGASVPAAFAVGAVLFAVRSMGLSDGMTLLVGVPASLLAAAVTALLGLSRDERRTLTDALRPARARA